MIRSVGVALLLLGAVVSGRACTCGASARARPTPSSEAGAGATPRAHADPDLWRTAAVFSSPIAALHANHVTVVAGLVADEGVVRAMATRDGQRLWTVDVERGASWAADAQLNLEAAGDGVVVLWRGGRAQAHTGTAHWLGPAGELRGDSRDVGPAFCATSAGLAWTASETHGPTHVQAKAWSEPRARDMLTVPPGRAPALVCGDRVVFVLGDGDDDLTEASFAPGDVSASPPLAVIRDADFSEDELEHEAYAVHDDLEILRVA